MHKRLAYYGYIVIYGAVPKDVCKEILKSAKEAAKQGEFHHVFLKPPKVYDPCRLQAPVDSDMVTKLNDLVMPTVGIHFPKAYTQDWYYLKSRPGDDKQHPHRDYKLPTLGMSHSSILETFMRL